MLLAIDPGEHTGLAWRLPDGTTGHDTRHIHPMRKLPSLYNILTDLHQANPIATIAYEVPWVGRFPAVARSLHHYEAVIMLWGAQHIVPVLGYTPMEIKAAVGASKSKESVMARVEALGFKPATQHEADAMALLQLMMHGKQPAKIVAAARRRKAKKQQPNLFRKRA